MGSLEQEERVQQVERARDEATAEAQFLRETLEEERNKNATAFQWVQNHRTMEMEENVSLQN